ncbi:MAG: winged helix-turn-helix domain-containing protein [Acidobacteriota bacterium]
MGNANRIYEFGAFRLDTLARRLLRDHTPVTLTPKSFELLQVLVENHGRALSKAELLHALWPDTTVEEGNLAFQVSVLRKALGPEAGACIETVPRYGYRLSAPVVVQPAAEPQTPPAGMDTAPGRKRRRYFAASALIVIAVAAGLFFATRRRAGVPVVAPVPLASFPGNEVTPSLSPDGKDVAFVWDGLSGDNWDVYVKVDGVEEPLRITSSKDLEFNPDWSPDGRQIAFARQADSGAIDVFLKPYPNGPERKVGQARGCFMLAAPYEKILDWHPNGEHLVVAGAAPERGCGLSALSTVTGAVTPLTEAPLPSMMDLAPAVSWDGRALAFMRGSAWSTFAVHTVVLSAGLKPVGAPRSVTTENRMESWPAWLPGSKEIVFSGGNASADTTLFRAPASGAARAVRMQGIGPSAYFPSVSAGGTLVYSSQGPSFASIHRLEIPSDPGSPPKVSDIASSTYLQQFPVYSPDGAHIAFESERSGCREIWVSSSDGTQLRRLTRFDGPAVQGVQWSPDGTRIVCSVALRGQREIYLIDSQRGTPQRLTADVYDDGGASWSRDGKWIYFHSNRSGEYQVWKMPAAGGESLQLTSSGGFVPQESPDGRFIYFTKRARDTSLWRMPAGGGPEVRVLDRLFQPAGAVVLEDGVYFITPAEQSSRASPPESKVRLLDTRTGQTRDIATITGPLGWGLAVAPDRRSLLFVRKKTGALDLKLVRQVQ